jgi:hypothetical protein
MAHDYTPPFEGGKTPDPAATAKTKNRAKNLARRAMKKAADYPLLKPGQKLKPMKMEEKEPPERPYRRVYEPTSAQALNPGLRARIDAASDAQKPRPLSGMRPIGKIKLMTREEVELDEEFINGREYAAHGLMHPKHAMQAIHQPSDRFVDFYASGTGDKMQGKVKSNTGKEVHIQAHPKMGDGKLHTFKVTTDLPKMTNEAKDEGEYDYEGDMAMSQLKSVITNAQKLHDMLEPNTNLPEWVQSKITLAEDYIVTAANYMDGEMNEEVEQVDEVGIMKKVGRSLAGWGAFDKDKPRDVVKNTRSMSNDMLSQIAIPRKNTLKSSPAALQQKVAKRELAKRNMGEEVEQIDELSKDFLTTKYGPKAMRAHLVAKAAGKRKTANKRAAGVNLASAKAYPNQFKGTERAAKVAATNEEAEQVEEGLVGSLVKAYVRPRAQKIVGNAVGQVANTFGASSQTKRRLQRAGMKWAKQKIGEEAEQIEEKKMGYEKLASAIKSRVAKKKLAVEATDPVGKEDADINNDGKTDKTDVYLHTKRRAIGKAIGTRLATKAGK